MSDAPDPRFRMTPTRRAWLEKLSEDPEPYPFGKNRMPGRAARDCRILRWTCHAYTDTERGDVISSDEARERYGQEIVDWWPKVQRFGDMITKYGRDALARHPA